MSKDTRYEFLDKVGAGSFATVFRARDHELGREVAIKQIHAQFLADPQSLERYWKEAQLLASLQHPNIVTIFDILKGKGWLIMELMQVNLRDRMGGKPMDLRSLRTTVAHSLRALSYLHESGIVHGDVKPANILVDHRKRIKLGDFGLARRLSATDGSLVKGTAKYMAPELVSEDFGPTGPQSDLYSLGFTTYELLCGTKFESLFPGLNAFSRDMNAAWMMWHAAPDRKLPEIDHILSGVPADLSKVIQKLATKNPAERYSNAQEALADLKLDTRADRGSDSIGSLPSSSAPPVDRKKRYIAIGAFAFSLLLSAVMLLAPNSPRPVTGPLKTFVGVIREIDQQRNTLEVEDPLTGMPDEFHVSEKPRIRLNAFKTPEQLILFKKLQAGDWVEFETPAEKADIRDLKVFRPQQSHGEILQVDEQTRRIQVVITEGQAREDVPLNIPVRTPLRLNGKPVDLGQLLVGDRVEVDHLLDPRAQMGQIASRLEAFRNVEFNVYLETVELPLRRIIAKSSRTNVKTETFTVAENCEVRWPDGRVLSLGELRPDDRLSLSGDSQIRKILVFRDEVELTGDLTAVDELQQKITISVFDAERSRQTLSVAKNAILRLQQQPLTLPELRPRFDRLSLRAAKDKDQLIVTSLNVERTVQHDRWAVLIGTSAYLDRTLSPLPHAAADARLIQNTLVNRYCFDPQWTSLSVDQKLREVNSEFDRILGFTRSGAQLIVFLCGHAYLSDEGRPYVALRDFHTDAMSKTGWPLDSVLDRIEACAASEKIVLLDLVHEGLGADLKKQPTLGGLLQAAQKLSNRPSGTRENSSELTAQWPTIRLFAPCGPQDRGREPPGGTGGIFAQKIARAYAGDADRDRDLTITSEELATSLSEQFELSPTPIRITVPEHR